MSRDWEPLSRVEGSSGRRLGAVGLSLLAVLVVVAIAAPLLAPYDPTARVATPFSTPSWRHLLGTDDVGHDIFSQLLFGARITLIVGLVAATVSTLIGTTLGLLAGYLRGWVDSVVMRAVDVVLSLPFLPLMIVVGVFLGPGVGTEILVISAVMWAGAARELRAQVLSVREREHVLSARSMGAGPVRTLAWHVGPEVAPLVIPQFVLAAKRAILFEAALSFLGLGAAGAGSWGTMLFNAHSRSAFLTDAWLWWVVPPGLAIALAVLAFAFIGYGFEERARPRLRGRERGAPARPSSAAGGPTHEQADGALLTVRGLTVVYDTGDQAVVAVDGFDLHVAENETVGLVGGSGAGKSTVALAAAGLLRPPARLRSGTIRLDGRDLLDAGPEERRRLRGDRIAFIPQDAMNALNPVFRIGDQIAEAITLHRGAPRHEVRQRVRSLLEKVGIDPDRERSYPHEFSGGMRQRAVIAMGLANDPELVIADEPTSGLDVVVQAEIVSLLEELRADLGLSLLVVSHDLPLVVRLADRIAVMRHGRVVEEGPAATIASDPQHPYTRDLLASVPRLRTQRAVG